MSSWLKERFNFNSNLVKEMFEYKSNKIKLSPVEIYDNYTSVIKVANWSIGIVQIEILNANVFIKKNDEKISNGLKTIKKEKNLKSIFLSCIDIEEGANYFYFIDTFTSKMVTSIIGFSLKDGIPYQRKVIMRKEIVPLIKFFLNSNTKTFN